MQVYSSAAYVGLAVTVVGHCHEVAIGGGADGGNAVGHRTAVVEHGVTWQFGVGSRVGFPRYYKV